MSSSTGVVRGCGAAAAAGRVLADQDPALHARPGALPAASGSHCRRQRAGRFSAATPVALTPPRVQGAGPDRDKPPVPGLCQLGERHRPLRPFHGPLKGDGLPHARQPQEVRTMVAVWLVTPSLWPCRKQMFVQTVI